MLFLPRRNMEPRFRAYSENRTLISTASISSTSTSRSIANSSSDIYFNISTVDKIPRNGWIVYGRVRVCRFSIDGTLKSARTTASRTKEAGLLVSSNARRLQRRSLSDITWTDPLQKVSFLFISDCTNATVLAASCTAATNVVEYCAAATDRSFFHFG